MKHVLIEPKWGFEAILMHMAIHAGLWRENPQEYLPKEESFSCPIRRMCHKPYSSETCNRNQSLRLAATASSKTSSCHCDLLGLLCRKLLKSSCGISTSGCSWLLVDLSHPFPVGSTQVSTDVYLPQTLSLLQWLCTPFSPVPWCMCPLLRKDVFLSVDHHNIYKYRVDFRDRALKTLILDFSLGVCLVK